MSNSLLLFTIGPVQDFIAAARRTRDLANGSHMLSFLASRAVRELWHQVGNDHVIFPSVMPGDLSYLSRLESSDEEMKRLMKIAAMPNRILAMVPTTQAADMAHRMSEAVRDELHAMSADFKKRAGSAFDTVDAKAWDAAIEHALEILWVARPMTGAYLDDYLATDRLMGIRKTRRDFVSLSGTGYVCSLTPTLSAIKPASDESLKPEKFNSFIAKFHEALAKVGGYRGLFDMTNNGKTEFSKEKLAPLSYLKRVYGTYIRDAYGLKFDSFDKTEDFISDNQRPYYALLHMDGDRIGKHLTESDAAKADGMAFHRDFSRKLMSFATDDVPRLIDLHKGQLLYAGGDDVMAMMRTDDASGCADAIRKAFSSSTGGLTMSAGIAVVHMQQPLREAWDNARSAEKSAKNLHGRDAVAYRIAKRSGQTLETGSRWQPEQAPAFVEGFLFKLRIHLQTPSDRSRKGISYKWIQDLTEFARVSDGLDKHAVLLECERLFNRHAESTSINLWEEVLRPWLYRHVSDTTRPERLLHAITELDTAYYLARGKDQ